MWRTHQQPIGQPTRGKTAPNRLRRLDVWVCRELRGLLRRGDGVFLDLGFGRVPLTTLESAHRFREIAPDLPVVGVELDPERVEAALPFSDPRTRFQRGGFDVDVGPVRVLRAMNVLRQYDESEVQTAMEEMSTHLVEGGWILEGTCSPFGRHLVVDLWEKRDGELVDRGILFSTNFRAGFDPAAFQAVLPKRYIHRMVPGEPVEQFFTAWKEAFLIGRAMDPFGPRAVFVETARQLDRAIDRRPWGLRHGYLWWRRDRA